MLKFINQFSFVIFSIFFLVLAGIFLLRGGMTWLRIAIFSVLLLGAVSAWLVLRPRQINGDLVRETIGAGKPVLLEFQSPY